MGADRNSWRSARAMAATVAEAVGGADGIRVFSFEKETGLDPVGMALPMQATNVANESGLLSNGVEAIGHRWSAQRIAHARSPQV